MSKVNQDHFHQQSKLPGHIGMGDWRATLSDRAITGRSLEDGKVSGSTNLTHFFLTR